MYDAIIERKVLKRKAKEEEKISHVLLTWRRRVSWWNEDITSPEYKHKYTVHCAEFGMQLMPVVNFFEWDAGMKNLLLVRTIEKPTDAADEIALVMDRRKTKTKEKSEINKEKMVLEVEKKRLEVKKKRLRVKQEQ